MKKATYILDKIENGIIYLIDPNNGETTITNNAEKVVEEINKLYPLFRVVYLDTDNQWWELLHESGDFREFREFDKK